MTSRREAARKGQSSTKRCALPLTMHVSNDMHLATQGTLTTSSSVEPYTRPPPARDSSCSMRSASHQCMHWSTQCENRTRHTKHINSSRTHTPPAVHSYMPPVVGHPPCHTGGNHNRMAELRGCPRREQSRPQGTRHCAAHVKRHHISQSNSEAGYHHRQGAIISLKHRTINH